MLKPTFLILSLLIHLLFLLLNTQFSKLPEKSSTTLKVKIKQPIEDSLMGDKAKSPSPIKRAANSKKKGLTSFSQLRVTETQSISPLGGLGDQTCVVDILKSVGRYPNSFFHHNITGFAQYRISVLKDSIHLKAGPHSHQHLRGLLCLDFHQSLKNLKENTCLKELTRGRGTLQFTFRLTLGNHETPENTFEQIGEKLFHRKILRIPKKSAMRALMAISNVFTLLDLKESEKDKREWQSFKSLYPRLPCHHLEYQI